MSRSNVKERERTRCVGIILNKRKALLDILIGNNNFDAKTKKCLRRAIALLSDIAVEIAEAPQSATAKDVIYPTGEFSSEEMERALAIIEEQNANPFDGG